MSVNCVLQFLSVGRIRHGDESKQTCHNTQAVFLCTFGLLTQTHTYQWTHDVRKRSSVA